MTMYAQSRYPVRRDLDAIHSRQFAGLGAPGTWGDGNQRLAIVQEARTARVAAAVQEAAEEPQVNDADLPDAARRLARQLAVEPKDIDREFYQQAIADGLADASYVEITGLVARCVNFDVLARGLGMAMLPLPTAEPGQPSRRRPREAVREGAWVPTIPNGRAGGVTGAALYGGNMLPNIIRCLSMVPDEMRANLELEEIQYLPLGRYLEYDYAHHEGLSRSQVELLAGRVSALNECFY